MSSLKLKTPSGGSVSFNAEDTGSDYTLTVPAGNANVLTNATAGTILQVKQTTTNSTISVTGSTYTATGHTLSITPSSANSKILVMLQGGLYFAATDTDEAHTEIYRDIDGGGYSQIDTYGAVTPMDISGAYGATLRVSHSICWLDSPNTTGVITYQPFTRCNTTTTVYYNMGTCIVTLTAMEIAG